MQSVCVNHDRMVQKTHLVQWLNILFKAVRTCTMTGVKLVYLAARLGYRPHIFSTMAESI